MVKLIMMMVTILIVLAAGLTLNATYKQKKAAARQVQIIETDPAYKTK